MKKYIRILEFLRFTTLQIRNVTYPNKNVTTTTKRHNTRKTTYPSKRKTFLKIQDRIPDPVKTTTICAASWAHAMAPWP